MRRQRMENKTLYVLNNELMSNWGATCALSDEQVGKMTADEQWYYELKVLYPYSYET